MMEWKEPESYWGFFEPRWWDSRKSIPLTFGWLAEYFNRGLVAADKWWNDR